MFFPTHLPLSVPGHLGIRVHSGFEVHIGHIHAHVPGQHDTRSKGESGGCAPGDMPSRAPNPHPAPTWTHAIVPCPRPRTTGPGPVSQMMQFAAMGTNSDIGQENVGVRAGKQDKSSLGCGCLHHLSPGNLQRLTEKTWRRMRRWRVVLSSSAARPLLGLPYFQQTMCE